MKELMIGVVNNCYLFLSILSNDEAGAALIELMKLEDPLPRWKDPKLPYKLLWSAAQLRDIVEARQRGCIVSASDLETKTTVPWRHGPGCP